MQPKKIVLPKKKIVKPQPKQEYLKPKKPKQPELVEPHTYASMCLPRHLILEIKNKFKTGKIAETCERVLEMSHPDAFTEEIK